MRLQLWARANKIDEAKMLERALWFAMGSDEKSNGLDFRCPEEDDIVAFASELLAA